MIEAQYYIVRAHSSGLVTKPIQVVDPNSLIYITLGIRGYDILSAYPLRGFVDEKQDKTTWIANLGLLGKMAGAAAVVNTEMTKLDSGRIFINTSLKALGILGKHFPDLSERELTRTPRNVYLNAPYFLLRKYSSGNNSREGAAHKNPQTQ